MSDDEKRTGVAVDASGGPAVDPTKNVLDLVAASNQRIDDLAVERQLRVDAELRHLKETADIRAEHAKELRILEAARIDANRAFDVGTGERTAKDQAAQASVLATQLTAVATLNEAALRQVTEPLRASLAEVQRYQYESQGGKAQTTETRLSVGSAVAIVGVVFAVLLGLSGIAIALITQT